MSLAREVRILFGEAGAKVFEGEYRQGKADGIHRSWSLDGVLTLEVEMLEGEYHGSYKSWWNDGVPKEEGTYLQGRRVGVYRWYKSTGEIWQEHDFGDAL